MIFVFIVWCPIRNNTTLIGWVLKKLIFHKKNCSGCTYLLSIQYGEKLKNKVIQSEEFNVKGSQHYNVLVLINHYQDLKKIILISIQCMCVCMCVCDPKTESDYNFPHIYIYTHIYAHTHTHTHIHQYPYKHTHAHIYIYIYIYKNIYDRNM